MLHSIFSHVICTLVKMLDSCRGQNHRSGGKQHPAFGNTGGEDRRKMIEIKEVEVIPRDENLHRLWRRNFKKDPRELRIMKKSYIAEDYL